MGMIGGGKTFIGAIHRIAANMDGLIELHCGAFSSNLQTSIESGRDFSESKCYGSYHEMLVTK
jgi:predicted dehydrogenase